MLFWLDAIHAMMMMTMVVTWTMTPQSTKGAQAFEFLSCDCRVQRPPSSQQAAKNCFVPRGGERGTRSQSLESRIQNLDPRHFPENCILCSVLHIYDTNIVHCRFHVNPPTEHQCSSSSSSYALSILTLPNSSYSALQQVPCQPPLHKHQRHPLLSYHVRLTQRNQGMVLQVWGPFIWQCCQHFESNEFPVDSESDNCDMIMCHL